MEGMKNQVALSSFFIFLMGLFLVPGRCLCFVMLSSEVCIVCLCFMLYDLCRTLHVVAAVGCMMLLYDDTWIPTILEVISELRILLLVPTTAVM